MWFAYFLIGYVLCLSCLCYSANSSNQRLRTNLYLFILFLPLVLFSALRYPKYGTDTYVYAEMFNSFVEMDCAFGENPYFGLFEPGFMLVSKVISLVTNNYQVFLLILNVFYIWACVRFVKKYSLSIWLSVFLFVGMGFFDQTMNVLRQFFALSIILCSYPYLEKKKYLKFSFLVILASFFHLSSLVFLIAILADKLSVNKKTLVIYFIVLLVSFVFSGRLIYFFLNQSGVYGQYLLSSDFGIAKESKLASVLHLFIDMVILCFCLWGWRGEAAKTRSNMLMIKLLMIGSVFWALATNLGVLGRMTSYFDIFAIILIPNILFSLRRKTNKLISVAIVLLLFVSKYFVISYLRPEWYGIYPYYFYFDY